MDRVFMSCFPGNGSSLACSVVVELLTDIIITRQEAEDEDTVKTRKQDKRQVVCFALTLISSYIG